MALINFPFSKDFEFGEFEAHYAELLGIDIIDTNVLRSISMEYCYGGFPLKSLFSDINFTQSEKDPLSATIKLKPTSGSGVDTLTIKDVSLRQFVASGMPKKEWYERGWIDNSGYWVPKEKGYWKDFGDAQYRLELAHSETWRWSIILKRSGHSVGEVVIEGDDRISDIELVNNCTTTTGFEFKIKMSGRTYHGGIDVDPEFEAFYRLISEIQAGSVPKQSGLSSELTAGDPLYEEGTRRIFGFGSNTIYGGSKGWGPTKENINQLTPDKTIHINLNRYRTLIDTCSDPK